MIGETILRYRLSTAWILACSWTVWYLELTQGKGGIHR